MRLRLLLVGGLSLPLLAQSGGSRDADLKAKASRLRAKIESAPRLPLVETRLAVKLPPGQELGMVSGLAYDAKARLIWIIQRGEKADPVIAVDENGRVVHSFGKGEFVTPHSIRVDREGRVWTVDSGSSKLLRFEADGDELANVTFAKPPNSPPDFGGITDVAFGTDGRIFVSDGYANAQVLYTTPAMKILHWGSAGSGPGQFHLPHALAVDQHGIVYVADRENGRIEKFTERGKYLGEIAGLGRTYAVALGPHGTIWASMSPFDEPPGALGWIVEFDRRTGQELGYLPVNESRSLHCLELDGKGQPMTDVGNEVVVFKNGSTAR
jgi:DNA-binding beta-propeller fold protein YncE